MSDNKEIEPLETSFKRGILVSVISPQSNERQINEYLDELQFLAETAGIIGTGRVIQKLNHPNPKSYLGSGRLRELSQMIRDEVIHVAIFDDELSPSQFRNISKELECDIIDRTHLILEIFALRAHTASAKTQVELAQYQYLLPRLTRMWTHLERQRGGGITMRGPGETQIESDRRIVLDKIAKLKEQLKKIDRQMSEQRGNRGNLVRISLIGYTNVGKSTLMNVLTKSDQFAENKLFATLDTTVRKVVIQDVPFLLSDTVGFIRKLPAHLVESFKSTLDEVRESDVLMHIVDISHPNFEEQIKVVQQTLVEIGAVDKPVFLVFNKIDAYTLEEDKSWIAKMYTPSIFISASQKINIGKLRNDLYKIAVEIYAGRYPFSNFSYTS